MKYWRGYLVAFLFAAITWALVEFAKAHAVLVDMVYPYVTRMIISALADWTGGLSFCLWQVIVLGLVTGGLASIVLMVILRWNPIQWFGWVMAVISLVSMLNMGLYGLNEYAGPLADDIRLQVADYTVPELNEAAIYFRDRANELAGKVKRDGEGNPKVGSFEELAAQAAEGFEYLTYEEAISVFAGSTAPVKELTWGASKGVSGKIMPLTGEAAVNPDVPAAALPFAICKEMARRMTIYSEADANFAAFYAGIYNSDPDFQYSAYLMAYYYCYTALQSVPTSTAKTLATTTHAGANKMLKQDLEACQDFFGTESAAASDRAETRQTDVDTKNEVSIVTFSSYSDVADLLTSWHIQNFVLPEHQEEVVEFNPKDPNQVDLTGIVNAKPAS